MFKKARLPIRKLFTDKCTITNTQLITDVYGATTSVDEVICTDEACRISYSNFNNADDSNNGATSITQQIKLFIREDLTILAGSKITVNRNGNITQYKASGVPAIYDNHQEINLDLVEKYA